MTNNLRRLPAPDTLSPVGGSAPSDVGSMPHTTQATNALGHAVAEIEVTHDQSTLWVNSPARCIARFSHRGFEVTAHGGTPLAQRAGHITSNDWHDFRVLVRHHLGLELPTLSPVT